jgi:ABC-type branched-subunit amino acid transport system substrate-binding protein
LTRKNHVLGVLCPLVIFLASCATLTPTAVDKSELAVTAPISLSPTPIPKPTHIDVSFLLNVQDVTVSTLAGDGHWGYRDGPGIQARFLGPEGLVIDREGNIYVTEILGNRIRRINPEGTVSTVAGTGIAGYSDGPASSAQFDSPSGITLDSAGNLYVADSFNHSIRVVRPDGTVATLAGDGKAGYRDGSAEQAQFNLPTGIALSNTGVLYVADTGNNRIRAISLEGTVTTLTGSGERGFKDGPPELAQFNAPGYLSIGPDGNIYTSESCEPNGNHAIRRITLEGAVTTVAGIGIPGRADGPAPKAGFSCPRGLVFDRAGNLYIADAGNDRIRVITPDDMVYTLAGKGTNGYVDGEGQQAAFLLVKGIALDDKRQLYVSDMITSRIRVIQLPETLIASPAPTTPDPYAGQNVIKIGFVDEVYYGGLVSVPTGNAVQLAINEANAAGCVMVAGTCYTLALVRAQDWVQPPDAGPQAAARALIDEGVVAVVGHVLSENSLAGAEEYGPAGVVMVSMSSSDPRVTQAGWPSIYRVTSNDAYMAPVAASLTYEKLGLRRAVMLGEPDPHVITAMDAWQKAFMSLGGQVLGRFEGEIDFPEKVMLQIHDLAPEAIIFFPTRTLLLSSAVQQILESNPSTVIVGVESFSVDPTFLPALGRAAEGIYDAVPGVPPDFMPGYASFEQRYIEAGFVVMPDPDQILAKFNPFAYDAANIIIAAIRMAAENGEVSPHSVGSAMETFHRQAYHGVTGAIQFDEFGDLLDQPVYFKRVVNGQWVDFMP